MSEQYPRTSAGTRCPMCLDKKAKGLIVHGGACYQWTGFEEDGSPANAVVEAYETYLGCVEAMVREAALYS